MLPFVFSDNEAACLMCLQLLGRLKRDRTFLARCCPSCVVKVAMLKRLWLGDGLVDHCGESISHSMLAWTTTLTHRSPLSSSSPSLQRHLFKKHIASVCKKRGGVKTTLHAESLVEYSESAHHYMPDLYKAQPIMNVKWSNRLISIIIRQNRNMYF